MHRFFVDGSAVGASRIEITSKEDVTHIGRVLRLRAGDRILVSDGNGREYTCILSEIGRESVAAVIEETRENETEPPVRVTLYQGVPKGGKLDVTIQKCIELGVSEIVPVFMKRSVKADKGNFGKKAERMRAIAEAAAKQSGRGIIPGISDSMTFASMLKDLAAYPLVLFPYENEDGMTIRDALREAKSSGILPDADHKETAAKGQPRVAVIIGPEGGFADEEAAALKELESVRCVSLGRRILRTETAGMAVMAMLLYELEL